MSPLDYDPAYFVVYLGLTLGLPAAGIVLLRFVLQSATCIASKVIEHKFRDYGQYTRPIDQKFEDASSDIRNKLLGS
ncbi:MAG: hypothetical protein ACREBU_21970 [Nitrososphaera sp.]